MKDHWCFMTDEQKRAFVTGLTMHATIYCKHVNELVDETIPEGFRGGAEVFASMSPVKATIMRHLGYQLGKDSRDEEWMQEVLDFLSECLEEVVCKVKERYKIKHPNPEDN